MGYEVKLYVGSVSSGVPSLDGDRSYLMKICEIDLCKTGFGMDTSKGTKVYTFMDDGNTKIEKDRYDSEFLAYPINDVIKELVKTNKEEKIRHAAKYPNTVFHAYRRHTIALKLLRAVKKEFDERENVMVAFFGH